MAAHAGHTAVTAIQFLLTEGAASLALAVVAIALGRAGLRAGASKVAGITLATGVVAAAVALVQCGLGVYLATSVVPADQVGTAGKLAEVINRLDDVKMLVLAIMAVAGTLMARRTGLLPRWLRWTGAALAVAIAASGVGYALLNNAFAQAAWVSLPLLLIWVTGAGLVLGRPGGQQPVGDLGLDQLVPLLEAEGVRRVVVTSDDPGATRRQVGRSVAVRHRDELLRVQAEMAAVPGVTVLIHDQECAAEKRRKRRRGNVKTSVTRVLINERICEGCGDCGSKSNCLSVQPVASEFGRKTRINQSSCNLDYSCIDGDCPAFVIVTPGRERRGVVPEVTAPPEPVRVATANSDRFSIRIAGIGGTGVVTVAQILAAASVMENRFVRTLDQTGLAQKGGAVVSDIVISTSALPRSPRLAAGECDLYLGCDALVATDPANMRAAAADRTVMVLSTSQVPTGGMIVSTATHYPDSDRIAAVARAGSQRTYLLDAAGLAERHLHDEQYANMLLVGAAYQTGVLPIGAHAIEQAIRVNRVAVDANLAAFRLGRRVIAGHDTPAPAAATSQLDEVATILDVRIPDLAAYQDAGYAQRYAEFVETLRTAERRITGGSALTAAVARNLYKLMAYKDEYEVARLSLHPGLAASVEDAFGTGARYRYQLHPPVLRALGMRHKVSLGPWFRPVLRGLVSLRFLRGNRLDPFGHTKVRRMERALIGDYRAVVEQLLAGLTGGNSDLAVEIAELPDLVRGYEEIKVANVAAYRRRTEDLLLRYRAVPAGGGR